MGIWTDRKCWNVQSILFFSKVQPHFLPQLSVGINPRMLETANFQLQTNMQKAKKTLTRFCSIQDCSEPRLSKTLHYCFSVKISVCFSHTHRLHNFNKSLIQQFSVCLGWFDEAVFCVFHWFLDESSLPNIANSVEMPQNWFSSDLLLSFENSLINSFYF